MTTACNDRHKRRNARNSRRTIPSDISEMLHYLEAQFREVQGDIAFLALKQSELRPDNEIAFFGLLQAREHLAIQQSLLIGHARMVQDLVRKKHIVLHPDKQRLLTKIANYSGLTCLGL